jgi:hypothetical protein
VNKTSIEWQLLTAAKRIGVSREEYMHRLSLGEKWCTQCKAWHARSAFGIDATRGDGLSARCLASKRVKQRTIRFPNRKRGWMEQARDGDKRQARRRVNYLVEQGRMPRPNDLPCFDCGRSSSPGAARHEYDHCQGYSSNHQLDVQPVCANCHRKREAARRAKAA